VRGASGARIESRRDEKRVTNRYVHATAVDLQTAIDRGFGRGNRVVTGGEAGR